MPRPDSDRALRAIAADLAILDPRDVEAVLSRLTTAQKQAMLTLMAQTKDDAGPVEALKTDALSPWLADRVRQTPSIDASRREGFALTPHARTTLERLAQGLFASTPVQTRDSRPTRGFAELLQGRSRS